MRGDLRSAAGGRANGRRTAIEKAVLAYARERPEEGQARVAQALRRRGLAVSPTGVRNLWREHGLETVFKRLRAIDSQAPGQGVLTARQRAILRRGEAVIRLRQRTRRPAPGEEQPRDERRAQIVLAAAELFIRHGYAGTSMRDIADWVGLLPGSVYHYFPAKEDLFVAVNHEGFQRLTTRVRAALVDAGSPRERFEAACATHVELVVAGDAIERFGATALFSIHEDRLQRRMQADREAYDALFRRLIAELDLPRGVDRTVFRLSLFGALNWTRLWYRRGRRTPADIGRQIAAIYCASAR